jgi:hypothetical protein
MSRATKKKLLDAIYEWNLWGVGGKCGLEGAVCVEKGIRNVRLGGQNDK